LTFQALKNFEAALSLENGQILSLKKYLPALFNLKLFVNGSFLLFDSPMFRGVLQMMVDE
jgi:hypothetical protein